MLSKAPRYLRLHAVPSRIMTLKLCLFAMSFSADVHRGYGWSGSAGLPTNGGNSMYYFQIGYISQSSMGELLCPGYAVFLLRLTLNSRESLHANLIYQESFFSLNT
jgi:hypothetical protein